MFSLDLIWDEYLNNKEQFIGRVVGYDGDLAPFNQTFYYLLPQCNLEKLYLKLKTIRL